MPHAFHRGELLRQRIIIDLSYELSLDKLSEILGRIWVSCMLLFRLCISMARVSLLLLVIMVVRVRHSSEACDGFRKNGEGLLSFPDSGLERGLYGFGDEVSHCEMLVKESGWQSRIEGSRDR